MVGAAGTWVGAAAAPSAFGARSMLLAGAAGLAAGLWAWARTVPGQSTRGGATRSGAVRVPMAALAVLGGALLIGAHVGARADAAYQPAPPGPLRAAATLVGDPEPVGVAGWRVELRLADGRRIEARAYGAAAGRLHRLTFGVPVMVEGSVQPIGERSWLRARHVVARAALTSIESTGPPIPPIQVAEAARERIAAGGRAIDTGPGADLGPLYDGLVLGDDRFQTEGQELRFRLSGLTHLLAVSGQNVAFVLAATEPLLRRLAPRGRLVAVVAVLALFAVVTRLEPSVLRAVVTAALSTWAAIGGRARSGLGVLAATVTVLVWVDPFLVDAVGFQLSVAASAGILLLGPVIVTRSPGPPWLAQPLATSLAAQLGVAPVLHHHFGPPPLVALPANLAAGWAAGAIMTWGLTVGVVAGMLPDWLGGLLQWPVGLLLWWLDTVATVGARLPGPRADPATLVALVGLSALVRVRPDRWVRLLVVISVAVVILVSIPSPPTRPGPCGRGITWYPRGAGQRSVLVVGERAGVGAVEACRLANIRRADLLVTQGGGRGEAATVAALGEVISVGSIVAPPQHVVLTATRLREAVMVPVVDGWLEVRPDRAGRHLDVTYSEGRPR